MTTTTHDTMTPEQLVAATAEAMCLTVVGKAVEGEHGLGLPVLGRPSGYFNPLTSIADQWAIECWMYDHGLDNYQLRMGPMKGSHASRLRARGIALMRAGLKAMASKELANDPTTAV